MQQNGGRRALIIAIAAVGWLGLCDLARAQEEDESKSIKAEIFLKDRPAATKRTRPAGRYKPGPKSTNDINASPPPGTSFVQVGVTLWRFRPSTPADKTKELVEEDDNRTTEWTLERIEEGTPLLPGQRVRLSIESLTRSGYLYVVDREQYADGMVGEPVLIFPTLKTRDQNYVKAGRVINIPSGTGKFNIKPSEGPKVHVGELLTLIVSSQPLIDPNDLRAKAIKLPREQVELWEKQWGAQAEKFELDGGAGQPMTEREQTIRTNNSQYLTQDDPVPQTVYRMAIKTNHSIVLNVPLKFRQ
jgi:hypothetical protein